MHVKYTCYTPENGLVMFATLKNPYFDPSHISEASEIFLSMILKNDPCLQNGTVKLFYVIFGPGPNQLKLLLTASTRFVILMLLIL